MEHYLVNKIKADEDMKFLYECLKDCGRPQNTSF